MVSQADYTFSGSFKRRSSWANCTSGLLYLGRTRRFRSFNSPLPTACEASILMSGTAALQPFSYDCRHIQNGFARAIFHIGSNDRLTVRRRFLSPRSDCHHFYYAATGQTANVALTVVPGGHPCISFGATVPRASRIGDLAPGKGVLAEGHNPNAFSLPGPGHLRMYLGTASDFVRVSMLVR